MCSHYSNQQGRFSGPVVNTLDYKTGVVSSIPRPTIILGIISDGTIYGRPIYWCCTPNLSMYVSTRNASGFDVFNVSYNIPQQ